jgi:hypothetical protein
MDKFNELTTGAKLVLGAAIVFLIVSFFEWFEVGGDIGEAVEAIGGDNGVSMWNGVGWIAGLLAIALIVWQAIRLANIDLEIGVTPAMITAALAALTLLFTVIRFIDKPGGDAVDRTFWAWLGLALAIVIAIGAWMNMQASGESLADIRSSVAGATASARERVDRTDEPAAPSTTTPAVEDTTPSTPEAPPVVDDDDTPRAS